MKASLETGNAALKDKIKIFLGQQIPARF